MNVFDLVATLTLDSSEYDSGLNESEEKAEGFGSKLKGALGTAGKIGAGALTAVTTAGVAAAGAFVAGTKQVAEYGDNIDKQSQKLGISAEAYQEWDAILQHSGTSAGALTGAMRTMVKATESNTEAFAQLGISEEQIATMSKEELFSSVITGLQGMGEGLERDKLATELLGRGAVEMGALLNTSAEDTEAMRQRVHELGGVMSDEAVKSAAAFQDSLQDMTTSFQSLGRGILSDFMPTITKVMDGLAMIFSGDTGGAKLISEGISDMIQKIKDAIPTLIDTGLELMDSLLDVIIDNLPQLIEAGVEIILKLTTGLVKAIPKLLEKAPEIIKAFLDALMKYAPELLKASLELIVTLGKGIVNNLPKVVEMGKQVFDTIKDTIKQKLSEAVQWGADLISNFVSGILSGIGNLIGALGRVGSTVKSYLGFSEPEKGPLSNFHTYAPDMIDLFVQGLKDSEGELQKQLNSMLNIEAPSIEAGASGNVYNGGAVTVNVYGAQGQDVNRLADAVMDRINFELGRQRRAIGWT